MDISGHQPGRFVTVVGEVSELTGGDAAGNQPLPMVKGDQAYLWGTRDRRGPYPRTTFGFGLGMRL